jgi:hypothetical protein
VAETTAYQRPVFKVRKIVEALFLDPEKAINPLLTSLSAAFLQEERQ